MSVKNLVQCPLITPVSSTATELLLGAVSAPYSLPPLDGGILVIADSVSKPSFVEFIKYTHRIDNVLYGVSRGQEETAARAWSGVTYVYQALTADQYTSELASKEPVIPPGTTAQYWRGDKSFQDLATAIRAANLTGFSTATNSAVVSTDTLLAALGKLQAQVSARLLSTANAVSATKLQTARTISVAGDATGSLTFDGTANVSMDVTLQPSGVTAGTYTKLTVDSKGRVTGGTILLVSDVPTLNQDTTGNAGTATKLQTSRTINGVLFDGTANITVADSTKEPAFAAGTTAQYRRGDKTWQDFATAVRASVMTGLSTVTATAVSATDTLLAAIGKLQAQITGLDTSKLDATANAVSASKLATARSIALAGDVTGSATFDGSSNVSITATVANDSHTHDTRYPVLSAERVLTGVAAGSWVTIAQVPSQGGRAYGEFIVYDTDSSKHNIVKIIASHTYGQSVVACVGGNRYGTRTIAHVRVLHGTVDRLNDGAKLQVYIENTCALRVRALMINQISGWSAWSEMTPVVEGTPAGWAEDTTTCYDDITNTATGFSGSFSGNGALLTGLNAANLASGTIPDARLSGTYTGVNITGNAATATKLATARTINGVAFDGTANITVADSTKLPLTGGTLTGSLGLPNSTTLTGTLNGVQVTNGANGTVEIGNRNTSYTHYASSTGNHYFYGTTTVQTNLSVGGSVTAASFSGSGSGLTAIPSAQLSGVVPDANLSGTYTGVNVTGNAGTATKLQTARTINGVAFDGTANITVADSTKLPTTGGTLTGALTAPVYSVQYAQEKVQALGAGSGTRTVDVTIGAYIQATANSTAATWTFNVAPSASYVTSWTLELVNGGLSAQTFTNVLWVGGTAPELSPSGTDVLVFTRVGTTTRGYLAAKDSR